MIKVAIHFPWSSPFPILSIYVLTMLITPPSVFSSLSCWDCCSLLLHFFLASASSSAAVSCDCEGFILVVSGTTIDSGAANTSALSVCRSDVQQPFKEPLWLHQQSKKNWLIGVIPPVVKIITSTLKGGNYSVWKMLLVILARWCEHPFEVSPSSSTHYYAAVSGTPAHETCIRGITFLFVTASSEASAAIVWMRDVVPPETCLHVTAFFPLCLQRHAMYEVKFRDIPMKDKGWVGCRTLFVVYGETQSHQWIHFNLLFSQHFSLW